MINFLLSCFVCSLYCIGLWVITDKGMILCEVKEWFKERIHPFIFKPLFGCVVCYASIHGGTLFLLFNGWTWTVFPAMVVIAANNYIIAQKYA